MSEQEKLQRGKRRTKIILITVTVLFIVLMLVVPLISVITSALKEGFKFYLQSITTEYVISALGVTLIATVIAVVVNTFFGICAAWLLTKFSFKGKQVLATLIDIPFSISPVIVGLAYLMTFGRLGWTYPAIRAVNSFFGTNIRIAFAIPGVILATIFVTFPFVSREIIPILNSQGKDEEETFNGLLSDIEIIDEQIDLTKDVESKKYNITSYNDIASRPVVEEIIDKLEVELEETEVCEQLKFTPNDILVKRDIDFINSIKYPEKYKNNTKFWKEYTREEKSDLIMKYVDEIELEEVFNGKCIPKFVKFRESIANASNELYFNGYYDRYVPSLFGNIYGNI